MSEYIKKGRACIKWLLEREDANLLEIEKLNGLIDAADKHRPEIELESKVEESVAMKEELQRGESLKMLQEYNTSLQQYNCHLQADAIKSAETIGKLKENNAKAAEINLLLIRLGAFKELAGKCSTELENAIIQCASLEENCSKQDETIKLLQFQVAQNEKERLKSDKCPMAWSSVESINQEELHQKLVQSDNFEQVLDTETDQLRKVSQNYKNDKKLWAAAISNLESKIKAMKQEQALLSLEAHKFTQVIPDSSKMIEAVRALVARCDDLKMKYQEEVAKRKKLHNIVQEIKGNIRVFCRCRPLSKVEKSSGFKGVVDFDGANDGEIGIMTGGTGKKIFTFDRVYTPKDDNAEVYADASPLVTSVLDGYNVCIFAYGQTGSGKTFTMEGTKGNRGVNYKTLEELFNIAEERKHTVRHDMYVSVLEVYNEQIRDLLATSSSSKNLEIKQAGDGSHHVPGIVEAKVQNIKEVWDVLQTGSTSRAVASNNVNERSSRSHCMLCIMVTAKNLINGDCTRSKLCLVDLAGSERLTKTDPQGDRLKEAVNINKSLSSLGDVISALASRSSHIPYRNSKLTQLLQDFLGGDSKALMFVQISPSENDTSETLSSLNFARRVHGIELGPAKKQVDTSEFQKVKQLERSKQKFRTLEENCKNLENKAKGKEQLYKKWQEEIVELERKLQQQHRLDSEIAALQQSIEELGLKLKEQEQQRSAAESKLLHDEKLQEKQEERAGRRGDPGAAVDVSVRKRCRALGGGGGPLFQGGMASSSKTQAGPGRQTLMGLRLGVSVCGGPLFQGGMASSSKTQGWAR